MLEHKSIGPEVTGFVITDLNVSKAGGSANSATRQTLLQRIVLGDVALNIPSVLVWMKEEKMVGEAQANTPEFKSWLGKGGGGIGAIKKTP